MVPKVANKFFLSWTSWSFFKGVSQNTNLLWERLKIFLETDVSQHKPPGP